jgi:hypothetical protein
MALTITQANAVNIAARYVMGRSSEHGVPKPSQAEALEAALLPLIAAANKALGAGLRPAEIEEFLGRSAS